MKVISVYLCECTVRLREISESKGESKFRDAVTEVFIIIIIFLHVRTHVVLKVSL